MVKIPPVLFTFDPSVNAAGIAVFVDGVLAGAERINGKRGEDAFKRALDGAARAAVFMSRWRFCCGGAAMALTEFPVVYPNGQTKNPNDLLILAGQATAFGLAAGAYTEVQERVFPRDWKGTLDADVMTGAILKRLKPEELKVLGALVKNHNVVDAVGIGLHALGRLR